MEAVDYNQTIALQYAAYRPLLHQKILANCLTNSEYAIGLDVGCGTGQSAIALTDFCEQVIGVEPSQAMLKKAIPHQQVEYQHYDGQQFDFLDNQFEIITFAGVLYYAKSQQLLHEVIRVAKNKATVVVYDFKVLLKAILKKLLLNISPSSTSPYNHQVNFDGLEQQNLIKNISDQQSIQLDIQIADLAHLFLSSKENYQLFAHYFNHLQPYDLVLEQLQLIFDDKTAAAPVETYFTVYTVAKAS
ncbi:MAG: class I SAM-dependent methyltransferase [Bacteroidota bacterium]